MDKVILAAKLVFSGNELPGVGKKIAGHSLGRVMCSLTVKPAVILLKTVGNFDLYQKQMSDPKSGRI
jgi:hypothetical protein